MVSLGVNKQGVYSGDDLNKLLELFQQVPNARVRVVTDQSNDLIGRLISLLIFM